MSLLGRVVGWVRDKINELAYAYQEKQRKRRQKLYDDYRQYESQCYSEISRIRRQTAEKISALGVQYGNRIAEIRRREVLLKQNVNREIYEKILAKLSEEENDVKELLAELDDVIENINKVSKMQQKTYIRAKSINKLKTEIIESKNKYYGYLWYLGQYKKRRLEYLFEREGEIAEPYAESIPQNVLYNGKLFQIKKSELSEAGSLRINESMTSEYVCHDIEFAEDFDDEAYINVLVVGREGYKHEISCSKGHFKYMAIKQPTIGIEALVTGYSDKDVILDYYGLQLILPKKELDNPRRIPPRGSKIRVYALWYKNNLSESPHVTEKYERSMNWADLGKIPLAVCDHNKDEFKAFIEKNGMIMSQASWKVSPLNSDYTELKVQLGSEHVMKCSIHENEIGLKYLYFEGFLDKTELINIEDIFVEVDTVIKVFRGENFARDPESISDEIKEDFECFVLYISNEFNEQKSIQESSEGIGYYNKWSELTGALINVLSAGRPIKCDIADAEYAGIDYKTGEKRTRAYIINSEEILELVEKISNINFRTEYFISINNNRYVVEFAGDASYITIYGNFDVEFIYEEYNILNVYPKTMPYPEIMQKIALNTFREGRIANSKLKTYLLNGNNIVETDNGERVEIFFNSSIETNESQKLAVEKAIKEENLFLIQGPPGTGKTTVIKEIIQQHLYKFPNDKILIVSQANVAVDNVIRGLLDERITLISRDDIVRCGNEGSISDDIKDVIFENKKEEYLKRVESNRFSNPVKEAFRQQWLEILNNPEDETLVGECILKNHQLIGATCVGLEKKKLGLNEIVFDLVIIDEAGKALPGEILIPINRAKKLILIGDHKQLPPVVNPALYDNEKCDMTDILEEEEKEDFLNESFFKRLYESCPKTNKVMLNTQFRMPSTIGSIVSDLFYNEERLQNGSNTFSKDPIIFDSNINLIDMSDIKDYQEVKQDNSGPYNEKECDVVIELLDYIRKNGYEKRVVIITPYKNQKRHLQKAVKDAGFDKIDINTIDAFQGDEEEIVIYCTTRSRHKTNYFSYASRLNVGLSRAKNELIIIGSKKYFYSYGEGSNLYNIAKAIERHGNVISAKSFLVNTNQNENYKIEI